MKRTVSIKLDVSGKESEKLLHLRSIYTQACNLAAFFARENRCWNRVALHHIAYYKIREKTNLGSQMSCIAIKEACGNYKALRIKKGKPVPEIKFKEKSIHFDKRTYSIKDNTLSLYTMQGRIKVKMIVGQFQADYLKTGFPKEAELILKKQTWFLNLVLDVDDAPPSNSKTVLGIDLGENNIATTSSGKIISGGKLRYDRDKCLNLRKRLQSNGSKSAKQLLRKLSGKERRHVKHVNHEISKIVVTEAIKTKSGIIALENLKNIRKRIKFGKRMNSRLHRWAWAQLQNMIIYKAEALGVSVNFVNPSYTSKTCSVCGNIGKRIKHKFSCLKCDFLAHADFNASLNIARIARSIDFARVAVTQPDVPISIENKAVCFS